MRNGHSHVLTDSDWVALSKAIAQVAKRYRHRAEDLTGEVLLAIWQRTTFQSYAHRFRYACKVMRFRSIDEMKRELRLVPLLPTARTAHLDDTNMEMPILNVLTDPQRRCIVLRGDGYSLAEIAQQTNLPRKTVHSHLSNGRRRLRLQLVQKAARPRPKA